MSVQGKEVSIVLPLKQSRNVSLFYSAKTGFEAIVSHQGRSYQILYGTHLIDVQRKGAAFLGMMIIEKLSEEEISTFSHALEVAVDFAGAIVPVANAIFQAERTVRTKIKRQVIKSMIQVVGLEGNWCSAVSTPEQMIQAYRQFYTEIQDKNNLKTINYDSSPYTFILPVVSQPERPEEPMDQLEFDEPAP